MHRLYCHSGMQIKDIVNAYLDGEGILEIAHREHVSTVKVRRILITAELWSCRSSQLTPPHKGSRLAGP